MKAIRIYKGDTGDKEWVKVIFEGNGDWLPKLEDIGLIAKLLWDVEENKYSNGKGGEMVREFLNEAMDGIPIRELCEKYQIPKISGEEKFKPFNTNEIK